METNRNTASGPVRIDLNGKRFGVGATSSGSVVGADTQLHLVQKGDRVFGRYAGGEVTRGNLVGRIHGDRISFRYAQIEVMGGLHAGRSDCEIRLVNGRLQLLEHYTWKTRQGSGTNTFEELTTR